MAAALGGQELPAFEGIVYGSHYNDRMAEKLAAKFGDITAEYAYEVIAPYVMMPKSNLHSVVFDLTALQLWAANANGLEPAGSQKHVRFDFAAALGK